MCENCFNILCCFVSSQCIYGCIRVWYCNLCIFIGMSMYSYCMFYVSSSCRLALFGCPDEVFFRAFSSVVRQMPGYNPQRWVTTRTLPKCLCFSVYCLFCVLLCSVCVCMCTVLLPPGGCSVAVNKYIIYHIKMSIPLWGTSTVLLNGYRGSVPVVCETDD
jgi:hypothetical protein